MIHFITFKIRILQYFLIIQALEDKFSDELKTQERFYNIKGNVGGLEGGSGSGASANMLKYSG